MSPERGTGHYAATVNEDSGDIRVFLNNADGSGTFGPFLAPEPIGDEASPNEPADFDNDGNTDLCVSATATENAWIMLGNGDATFSVAGPAKPPAAFNWTSSTPWSLLGSGRSR